MSCVFSIEEFATFDGPGIRMTVFLKGCPLSCKWCHNPEGQDPRPEYMRSPNGCLGCGACERVGTKDANGRIRLSAESVSACPRSLVRLCGVEYPPEELAEKVLKNAKLLAMNGGGVTFSGGEPLSDPPYLFSVMRLLRGKVHQAIQTAGYAPADVFAEALTLADYVLYDLKLFDPNLHKRFCGRDNALILANYKRLVASGVPFVTRIPLIPSVTDTEENISALAAFLRECGVTYVETLPYNRLAGSKYGSVLRKYEPGFDGDGPVAARTELFASFGITAKMM